MHAGWSWPTFHLTVVETTVPFSASRYPVPVPLEISAPQRRIHGIHGSSPSNVRNEGSCPIFGPQRWSTSPQAHGTGCAQHGRSRRSCLGPDKKKTSGGWKVIFFSSCRLRLPRSPKPLQTPKYDQTRQRAEPTNFQNLPKPHCLMVETPTVDRTFARY